MLANLDNEVIFKKAFTDKIVFEAFVKDVLNLDFVIGTIETEKQYDPPVGQIDFKLDIFAESADKRIIIEIQRIEYDYNFDRFLHYFLNSITQLQQSYRSYKIDKTVYGIVVMTAPYKIVDRTGRAVLNEVLLSQLNPKNLLGEEFRLFDHQLVFLNSYHKDEFTPPEIRDWLQLVDQSIHNPENPQINRSKMAIQRATELISLENLSPQELADRKKEESIKVNQQLIKEEGIAEGVELGKEAEQLATVQRGIENGLPNATIALITGWSEERIQEVREEMER